MLLTAESEGTLHAPPHLFHDFLPRIRLMEKDNKKARDDARREYNDTVRVSRSFTPSSHYHQLSMPYVVPGEIPPQTRPPLPKTPARTRRNRQTKRSSIESKTSRSQNTLLSSGRQLRRTRLAKNRPKQAAPPRRPRMGYS